MAQGTSRIVDTLHDDPASGLSHRLRSAETVPISRLFLLHGFGGNEANMMPIADAIDPCIEVVFVCGPLVIGAAQ